MTESDYLALCGWINDPAEVEKYVATLPMPVFADAAPGLKDSGANVDVFFFEFENKVCGGPLTDWHNLAQGIGDCVSHGWACGCQDLMMLQAASGEEEWKGLVATEPIYGGSRCEIGGWWNSYSDGSIGSYGSRWVSEYGVLLRQKYGDIDLSQYDPKRAKQWGAKGVPDQLEPIAKEHPVKTVSQVKTYEEVRDALCNLYPVPVASDVGFTMKRGTNGFCKRSGNWNHQMCFRGHCIAKGNQPAVVDKNSWGNYLGNENNRVQLESGREVILPPGHFLVYPEDVTRMARQGDTFAASRFTGFPAQKLPWIF